MKQTHVSSIPALREPSEDDLRRVFGDDRSSWLERPSVVVGPGSVRTRIGKPENSSAGAVKRGDLIEVRTAFDNRVRRRAVSETFMSDFLIVRVCTEDEWVAAQAEGREPNSVPWPAEDVRPL